MKKPWVKEGHYSLVWKLTGLGFGMFCFGFALVPLYDIICDITGLNGKTGGRYEAPLMQVVDTNRKVTVQFTTSNNESMPWEFKPLQQSVNVHPGEKKEVRFLAVNNTPRQMTAQAVPSVAPFSAAKYLHKIECFCFNQQVLKPGESIEMPLVFFIDQEIPERVDKITLSYTIFALPQVTVN